MGPVGVVEVGGDEFAQRGDAVVGTVPGFAVFHGFVRRIHDVSRRGDVHVAQVEGINAAAGGGEGGGFDGNRESRFTAQTLDSFSKLHNSLQKSVESVNHVDRFTGQKRGDVLRRRGHQPPSRRRRRPGDVRRNQAIGRLQQRIASAIGSTEITSRAAPAIFPCPARRPGRRR